MTKVILLATSDLIADQRVHRTALSLHEAGYDVIAVGRKLHYTSKEETPIYRVKHLRIFARKGFMFYALFNLFAFFYLIFKRFDIIQANDLDTLLAARLAGWLRKKPVIYDSHELFTEVPELNNRPKVRWFWSSLEKRLVKGLKHCSTVSEGVANELEQRHGVKFQVIRNLPLGKPLLNEYQPEKRIIVYQGALNVGRGLERLIVAMQHISNSTLWIVGKGDIEVQLKTLASELGLNDRVVFLGRIPYQSLQAITAKATIGVSIEEDLCISYRFALPNKLFDYIQAGLPVVVSDLYEMKSVVEKYGVGMTIPSNCDALSLAEILNDCMNNPAMMQEWHRNAMNAAKELVWENEKKLLLNLFRDALKD